jgi:F420-dependent oxidoreductase-like protein
LRYALLVEPQRGLTYETLRRVALRAEHLGFEALLRTDHLSSAGPGPERSSPEAWTTIAGLSRETARIRLGILVSPVTFRNPALLARMAVTIDAMSGGRLEVGLGAGWHVGEHSRHGLAFPALPERLGMLEETLTILRAMWTGEAATCHGKYFHVDGAVLQPRPVQRPHPPIIVGGSGGPRSARLAARHATEYNLVALAPADARSRVQGLVAAAEAIGRDPATLGRSVSVAVTIGREAGDRERRVRAARAEVGSLWDQRRSSWIDGDGRHLRERAEAYAAAGVTRLVLQDFVPEDLDMLDEIAEALEISRGAT